MTPYKNLVVIVFIIIILVSVCGCTSSNNNITNNTINNTTNSSTNNTTTYISAEKAKELAEPYTGKGVGQGTLEKPVLTTFNDVKVWKFPVNNGYYTIYINAVTGARVQ